MDRNVLGDAWRWLPSMTRCMLLDSAAALAHLAVNAHKLDEASYPPPLAPPTAPGVPSTGYQIGSAKSSPLHMADEESDMAASRSCTSSVAAAVASSVPQALHSMAQQLADSCQAVCSPLLTAMEIVNLGKTISEPFADCGHVLSDTAFSTDLCSTSSTGSFPGNSPSDSADTYLYILLMRAYLAASMAVTRPASAFVAWLLAVAACLETRPCSLMCLMFSQQHILSYHWRPWACCRPWCVWLMLLCACHG